MAWTDDSAIIVAMQCHTCVNPILDHNHSNQLSLVEIKLQDEGISPGEYHS